MNKHIKSLIFVLIGLIIAFPIFSITYYTMVRTSTPQFCASCHEIQFAVNTWKTSTHVNNAYSFYECKKRYNNFMEDARELIDHNRKAYKAKDYPNATGDKSKPAEVFNKKP